MYSLAAFGAVAFQGGVISRTRVASGSGHAVAVF